MGLDLIGSNIVWIMTIGGLSFFSRREIANFVAKTNLPIFWLFMLVGIIYSTVEENINCPPGGCFPIPPTIPIFFIFLVAHFLVLKIFKVKSFYLGILIFGLFGWVAEFFFGTYKEVLWSSPIIFLTMSIWTIITYAIVVIIPVTIFLKDKVSTRQA